jgi:nitrous oxide reductase accessory protein NosL
MTILTKGMGAILDKKFSKERKLLKKHLDKKKGKELDFDDVKKSYKIFTKKK